jgi:hypothetical protein
LSSILYYVTGHGFGHGVRSQQVLQALKARRPELDIHVRTTAPPWLFADPPGTARYSRAALDVGILQADGLEMDIDATLEACRELIGAAPRIVERELAFIRAHGIRLIVSDIPPLACEIAARGSLPSVAVTNFTWDTIYRTYLSAYAVFRPAVEQMTEWYSKATLALALPYPCEMRAFSSMKTIPWIARTSKLTKEQARSDFDLPESATIVLISFGGLGLERLPWDRLEQLKDFLFVATGKACVSDGNMIGLPDTQIHYEDLIRAADAIVTKPGYGIVADAIAHRVPILYTDRGDFAEYPRLVEALRDCATAEYIPQIELLAGNMGPYLRRLFSREAHWPAVRLDGSQVAAEKIIELLDECA